MTFRQEQIGEIETWCGEPDCNAAIAALRAHLDLTPIPRLKAGESLTNVQVGNLGESLAYLVGRHARFSESRFMMMGVNAGNPLASGSRTGLDLLWIAFHESDETLDHAWLQEVKTTRDSTNATYLDQLVVDHKKLFAESISLSLEARLWEASFTLKNSNQTQELDRRVRALGGRSAAEVRGVSLLPTGVHDRHVDAITAMEDVRLTLLDLGWREEMVLPVLIGISAIRSRFDELVVS
ncbi:MAG: hypothetical protein K8S21_13495 [Gemmatimonadetes bacterium]|nr:hypothetical protein [Gemmatimonadota bacterium]